MAEDLLTARAVRKEFGGLVACSDVDFTVPKGGIVSLIGPNGAGKTTFFNMLTGVYTPTSGEVVFDGREVVGLPPHAVTQLGVGRTFQNIRLFPTMTGLENVLVGMHSRLKGGIVKSIMRTPGIRGEERGAADRARELLQYCGLPREAEHTYAMNLAYGDQRRLEVARALGTEPKLLLLDEPTAGMNPQESAEFTTFVGRMRDERGLSDPHDRARHEGRHGHLRAGDRARPRREDRRGLAGRDPEERAGDRGLPGVGGDRRRRRRGGSAR